MEVARMTDQANGTPGFFDRIAGTVPAAAFSTRCGATAGPRLDKPASRPDLLAPEALAETLGPLWSGVRAEPAPRRLALALLAAQAVHGRRTALAWIEKAAIRLADAREADLRRHASRLLATAVGGTQDDAGEETDYLSACEDCCGEILARMPGLAEWIASAAAPHAFASTAFLSVLHAAKSAEGVLPDAYFLWLRIGDPLGWALMTDYGRPARFVVAVAANVHHAAEIAAGHPIRDPDMREAARLVAKHAA